MKCNTFTFSKATYQIINLAFRLPDGQKIKTMHLCIFNVKAFNFKI